MARAGNEPQRDVLHAGGVQLLLHSRKPLSDGFRRAMESMELPKERLCVIGDQIFADVMAANNCGAIAILVDPLPGKTRFPIFYATRRRKSAPILKEFEKLHGYGYYD